MNCYPSTDNGAQYVQETIAPSGATSSAGPPTGNDQGSTVGKTRDQLVVSRPGWLPAGSWDVVFFLTPYYAQQVVAVCFASGADVSTIRTYLRWALNSVPTKVWWEKQLPGWHDPNDYTIYNDAGVPTTIPTSMGFSFHCPILLREFFTDFATDVPLLKEVREIRRWGRYLTLAPVANATEMKGRIATASLQFNSALNPTVIPLTGGAPGPTPLPPQVNTPVGFTSLTLAVQESADLTYIFDGFRWHTSPAVPGAWEFSTVYPFPIYNSTGTTVVVTAFTQVTVTVNRVSAVSISVNFRTGGSNGPTFAVLAGTPPLNNQSLRVRDGSAVANITTNELARYSVTPIFAFESLLQADEKSYSNNWIEGATSRQCSGKDGMEFTPTREWRPLVRSGFNTEPVQVDPVAVKRDLVDLSGKWHIDYGTNLDANASVMVIYGTHYQFCCETDSKLMLFKRQVPERDDGAIKMAEELQAALPHTFPAQFNDGGILPMIMSRIKRVGVAGLQGITKQVVGELYNVLPKIGTADRVIGYPNYTSTYGNNSTSLLQVNGNGNGNGGRKKKGPRSNGRTLFRRMNIA